MKRPIASLIAAAIAVGWVADVAAQKRDRKVAVLEVRAGSTAAPDIGARLAGQLSSSTGLEVVAPDAARQRYGESLDADVTKCVGKAGCIARLAAALEVDEILLVGISELGDIILTLQRIRRGGEVASRLAEAMPASAKPSARDLDKYLRRVFPAADFERYGKIQIAANIRGASVWIGNKKIGVTPLSPVQVLAPKDYEVKVEKDGYSAFRASIAAVPERVVRVNPELSALQSDAWYKRWWVLAIAGGVTAAATVGVVILVTRDGDDVPVMVDPF